MPSPTLPGPRAPAAALAGALLLGAGVAAADPDPLDPTRLPTPVMYNYGESETTRSLAMGGALRALGNSTTAIYLNPAALAETRVYHIEAQAQLAPETGRQLYGGTIADSVTGRLAGAASFQGGFMDPKGVNRSQLDVRTSLAFPISERFFVGLGGRYLKLNQAIAKAPFGTQDQVSGGLEDTVGNPASRSSAVSTFTFDIGVIVKAGDNFYFAATGQNLTYPNDAILPTTVGGGIGYGNQNLSLEADGIADLTSWGKPTARIMGGGEYLVADHVPIRAGYRYDQGAKLHTVSLGLGYLTPEFSVEASVKRTLSDPGITTMVFSVAYFLESTGLTRAQSSTTDME